MKIRVNYLLDTAEVLGISSVDIKRVDPIYDRDAYQVTTWNRRKLVISSLDIFRYYNNKFGPL